MKIKFKEIKIHTDDTSTRLGLQLVITEPYDQGETIHEITLWGGLVNLIQIQDVVAKKIQELEKFSTTKFLRIEKCDDCPYCRENSKGTAITNYYCSKLLKDVEEVYLLTIHPDCPLPGRNEL